MKKITFTTLTVLLLSTTVFSQTQKEAGTILSSSNTISQVAGSRLNLLSPADGTQFNSSQAAKPVLFRWTAIIPKPKGSVTYRLKVWQLMEGQNGIEIMRSGTPVFSKDVTGLTQTAVSNLYTGPCKPPYLCDFIWTVEALPGDDITMGRNLGASDAYSFKYVGGIGTVTGSGGATVDLKETDKNQPTKKVQTGAQGDPVHGVDVKLGVKN